MYILQNLIWFNLGTISIGRIFVKKIVISKTGY